MSNWYALNKTNQDGSLDVYILDEIGGYGITAAQFIEEVHAGLVEGAELRVHINSPGGAVREGLAIYYFLKRLPKVTTIVEGVAASMASTVFMAGSNRIMPESTMLMVHDAWMQTQGDAKELRKQADDLEKLNESLVLIYSEATGRSAEEIKVLFDEDTWLSAKECEELGFATMVTDEVKIAASFDIAKLSTVPESLATAPQAKEDNMDEVTKLQESLALAESEISALKEEVEAERKDVFEEGVSNGEEQTLGRIKGRMDKYQDAEFVLATIDLSDSEVKDRYIERLESENKAKAEKLAALSVVDEDEGEEPVSSVATGNEPNEEAPLKGEALEGARAARVAELKAEGKTVEQAWKQVHAEMPDVK